MFDRPDALRRPADARPPRSRRRAPQGRGQRRPLRARPAAPGDGDAARPDRRRRTPDAERATQLLHGEGFIVYETRDGRPRLGPGRARRLRRLRQRRRPRAGAGAGPAGHRALVAGLCAARARGRGCWPSCRSSPRSGSRARPAASSGCATAAIVPRPHLAPVAGDFVAQAERFVGAPYLWGGRSIRGIDCSGAGAAGADRRRPAGAARFRHAGGAGRDAARRRTRRSRAATWCSGRAMSGSCAIPRRCCTPTAITWRWRPSR